MTQMRHRSLHILGVVGILACSGPIIGHAQAPVHDVVRDSVKAGLIHQLLSEVHATDQAILAMEANLPALRAASPRIPEVFWTRFMAQAKTHRGELEEMIAPIYDRHFSTSDLRELLAFYRTPIGRKFLAAQPALLQESTIAGQEWGRRIGAAVGEQLAAEGIRITP